MPPIFLDTAKSSFLPSPHFLHPTVATQPIISLIARDMQAVDMVIRQRLQSDVVLIRQVAQLYFDL